MPNLFQRKSFISALLCLAFLNCGSNKKNTDISTSDDVPLTGTTLNNTSGDKNKDEKPAEDENKKDDTNKDDANKDKTKTVVPPLSPIALDIFFPKKSTTPTKPSTINKPDEKVINKPTTIKPAVVPPKDMTGQRQDLKRTELDQLLTSPKLTPEEKALVQEYIKLINSPSGVTRDQTGSMFTLLDKIGSAATESPEATESSPSANVFKNSGMPETFKAFTDPALGIDQANFNYDKLNELLNKEQVLTKEEEAYLIKNYFEVIENKSPAFLSKLPLEKRIINTINLYVIEALSSRKPFTAALVAQFANTPQIKNIRLPSNTKNSLSLVLYAAKINKLLNPKAAKIETNDLIKVYNSMGETMDYEKHQMVPQQYTIVSIARFDFSDVNKKKIDPASLEMAIANDITYIWENLLKSSAGIMPPELYISGYTNKASTKEEDIKTSQKLNEIVMASTKLQFETYARGSMFNLPNEKPESLKNRRVEVIFKPFKTLPPK